MEKTQASSLSAAAPKEGKGTAVADRKTSPILKHGMKGDESDTSHHRSNLVLNIGFGAKIFIHIIFLKIKGTPTNN